MATTLDDMLMQRQVGVARMTADEVKKIDGFLRELDDEIRRRLDGQDLTELGRARLERMLERLDSYLSGGLDDYRKSLLQDLKRIAQMEGDYTTSAINLATDIGASAPTALQVQAAVMAAPLGIKGGDMGALLQPFVKDWADGVAKSVGNAIRLGVAQGKTNAQIVQSIRGTAANKYADGLLALTKRQADSVVTTAVQHVAQVARQFVFEANDDIVDQVQWVSTLDNRTCLSCAALDGETFDIDAGPRPPLHINCRCATIPVLNDQFAGASRGRTRPAVGENGAQKVSGAATYFDWLKTQPDDFQNFAIGTQRAALLRDGGLSASRFATLQLDKQFNPLSLDALESMIPGAFAAAGL